MRTREGSWRLPALVIPVLVCGCCAWSLLGAQMKLALGQSALIFLGQPATGTIAAVLPCHSGVELAGDASNPLAFSIGTGESNGRTVRVRYTDGSGRERIGQTVACTTLGAAAVGDPIALVYRAADPGAILLEKDHGVYRITEINSAIAVGLALLGVLLLVLPWRPALGRSPEEIRALSLRATGPNYYATQRIGLKEALLLLTLRRTDDPNNDAPRLGDNPKLLNDHMVLAAMLLELVAQRRIEVRPARRVGAGRLVVLDSSPVGEPDLDALLRELALSGGNTQLGHFYSQHSRRHVARLIAQLRQGGYVRLHEPRTGRYMPQRLQTRSPLLQWLMAALGPAAFSRGSVVPDDHSLAAYPRHLLYTIHTEAEERMFERVQAAVASRMPADDFTRRLLLLVAALYIARNQFPQGYATARSLYRFYPPEQRWEIIRTLRQLAATASPSEQAIYQQARQTDYQIENPPSA